MRGFLRALGILAALVVAVIALFWFNFYNIHVRYRLTVEVQDGDQLKTGSSVIEVSYAIVPDWIWVGPSSSGRVEGFAPTVDLGEKGLLFLSFRQSLRGPEQWRDRNAHVGCSFDDIRCLPFAAYGQPGVREPPSKEKAALRELLSQSGSRDVPFAVLPELIRFRDINDPNSYMAVSRDNLAASFGPGVELKRVILQLTDDPITPPPAIWPQWLKDQRLKEKGRTYSGTLY